MAIDQRDYYREHVQKQTGYVERARFRMSEADFQRLRTRRAWRRNFLVLGAVVLALLALAFVG